MILANPSAKCGWVAAPLLPDVFERALQGRVDYLRGLIFVRHRAGFNAIMTQASALAGLDQVGQREHSFQVSRQPSRNEAVSDRRQAIPSRRLR
jgi:hypothetical protein